MIRDQETLNQLVDMIRQFVEGVLIPHENEVAETDEIPQAIVEQMTRFIWFNHSEEYEGLGLTMEEESLSLLNWTYLACLSFTDWNQ
jgi:acyl-CoA dehydrogenase